MSSFNTARVEVTCHQAVAFGTSKRVGQDLVRNSVEGLVEFLVTGGPSRVTRRAQRGSIDRRRHPTLAVVMPIGTPRLRSLDQALEIEFSFTGLRSRSDGSLNLGDDL